MIMSGFLLVVLIIAVLASIAIIGMAIPLLLNANKELLNDIKAEIFSSNTVPVNNVIETVFLNEKHELETNVSNFALSGEFLGTIGAFDLITKTGIVTSKVSRSIIATTLDVERKHKKSFEISVLRNVNQTALDPFQRYGAKQASQFNDTEVFSSARLC